MKSKKSKSIVIFAVIVLIVLGFQYINHTGPFQSMLSQSKQQSSTDLKGKEKVHIIRVVDGDTFVARNSKGQQLKIRLIGVDTPETVKPNTPVQPCGKEASHFSKKNLTNKDVYLEYDKEKNDRYGRVLAYVWLDKDTLFNELLVKEGLAKEKYFAPNGKYRDVFIKAQNEAQKKKINLWS